MRSRARQLIANQPDSPSSAADTMGVVREGNVADLVLLNADPLVDIRNTTQVEAVVLRGQLIDRAARTALLEQARQSASGAK